MYFLIYEAIFGIDKLLHFSLYFIFSFTLGSGILMIGNKHLAGKIIAITWLVLVLIGALEEVRHFYLPNRDSELFDGIANMFGVSTGLMIPFLLAIVRTKNRIKTLRLVKLNLITILPIFFILFLLNEKPFYKELKIPTPQVYDESSK